MKIKCIKCGGDAELREEITTNGRYDAIVMLYMCLASLNDCNLVEWVEYA